MKKIIALILFTNLSMAHSVSEGDMEGAWVLVEKSFNNQQVFENGPTPMKYIHKVDFLLVGIPKMEKQVSMKDLIKFQMGKFWRRLRIAQLIQTLEIKFLMHQTLWVTSYLFIRKFNGYPQMDKNL